MSHWLFRKRVLYLVALLRKETYRDKASYASSSLCIRNMILHAQHRLKHVYIDCIQKERLFQRDCFYYIIVQTYAVELHSRSAIKSWSRMHHGLPWLNVEPLLTPQMSPIISGSFAEKNLLRNLSRSWSCMHISIPHPHIQRVSVSVSVSWCVCGVCAHVRVCSCVCVRVCACVDLCVCEKHRKRERERMCVRKCPTHTHTLSLSLSLDARHPSACACEDHVCVSVSLCVSVSVCHSVCLCIHLSACMSMYTCVFMCVCLSVCFCAASVYVWKHMILFLCRNPSFQTWDTWPPPQTHTHTRKHKY